jgi:hypothetical protein
MSNINEMLEIKHIYEKNTDRLELLKELINVIIDKTNKELESYMTANEDANRKAEIAENTWKNTFVKNLTDGAIACGDWVMSEKYYQKAKIDKKILDSADFDNLYIGGYIKDITRDDMRKEISLDKDEINKKAYNFTQSGDEPNTNNLKPVKKSPVNRINFGSKTRNDEPLNDENCPSIDITGYSNPYLDDVSLPYCNVADIMVKNQKDTDFKEATKRSYEMAAEADAKIAETNKPYTPISDALNTPEGKKALADSMAEPIKPISGRKINKVTSKVEKTKKESKIKVTRKPTTKKK